MTSCMLYHNGKDEYFSTRYQTEICSQHFLSRSLKVRFLLVRTKYMYIVTVLLAINEGTEGICDFRLTSLDHVTVTLKTQTGSFHLSDINIVPD